MIYLLVNTDFL